MTATFRQFEERSAREAADTGRRAAVRKAIASYDAAVAKGRTRFTDWQQARTRAAHIKWEAVNRLDRYLEEFERNVVAGGGHVHWAEDAGQARGIILDIARRNNVRKVVKGKSMATEEIHLNPALEAAGIQAVETDLGEFICQLRGEPPYHIVTPVMQLSRADIARTFHDRFGTALDATAEELAGIARERLRRDFLTADMGVTGANFAVAETGQIAISTNEGNARLSLSLPPVHVALVGIEKVVPRVEDLGLLWPLLAASGTGQPLTCYNTLVGGPRRGSEPDGPREFHVVLLDNGRSRLLADAEQRDALQCIRCGACLNVCPVFKSIGGHSYGTTYQGPIGSVITPHLRGDDFAHLPYASSLCGACTDVCPVRVDLHHHLLHNRRNAVRRHLDHPLQRVAFRLWLWAMRSEGRYRLAAGLSRFALRLGLARPAMGRWLKTRDLPAPPRQGFRDWWRESGGPKGGSGQ